MFNFVWLCCVAMPIRLRYQITSIPVCRHWLRHFYTRSFGSKNYCWHLQMMMMNGTYPVFDYKGIRYIASIACLPCLALLACLPALLGGLLLTNVIFSQLNYWILNIESVNECNIYDRTTLEISNFLFWDVYPHLYTPLVLFFGCSLYIRTVIRYKVWNEVEIYRIKN